MRTSSDRTLNYRMAKALGEALFYRKALCEKCQGGDSNPYGFLHQILSLARLPIPPPRQIAMLTKVASLDASGKLGL